LTETVATPIAEEAEQSLIGIAPRFTSLANWASVHWARGVGLPISPGGSWATTFLGSATLRGKPTLSGVWLLKVTTFVSWKGCEPACVSIEPPSFSGISS